MARTLSRQGQRALDAANAIAVQGMAARGEEERIALARQALALSPLCSTAHGLLAIAAQDPDEAIAHWRRAVSAATTVLGPVGLRRIATAEEASPAFGDYIHAMQALASALWNRGQRGEAIDALLRAVRADPDDEWSLRYTLIGRLLVVGRDDEASALLHALVDESDDRTAWRWATLLFAFRRQGDAAETRTVFLDTVTRNPLVPEALILGEFPPERFPKDVGPLDPAREPYDDADSVADVLSEAWHATPGAIAWLQAMVADTGVSGP